MSSISDGAKTLILNSNKIVFKLLRGLLAEQEIKNIIKNKKT